MKIDSGVAIDHHLFRLTLRNKLYLAPVGQLRNVLDIGTGTGEFHRSKFFFAKTNNLRLMGA
jgi:hypothetical protein